MESKNYSFRNYIVIFYFSLIAAVQSSCGPEIANLKCFREYIEDWNAGGLQKELALVGKPVSTKSEICPVTKSTIGSREPIHKNQHKKASGFNIDSEDEKKKKLASAFTSVGKQKNPELNNSITQAEGVTRSSVDSNMHWKPVEGSYGMYIGILFTDRMFMQLCAVEIGVLLFVMGASYCYYKEMKKTEKHVEDVLVKAQEIAHGEVKSIEKHVSEVLTRAREDADKMADEISSSHRFPERYEEMEPNSSNDELAFMTLSSMVYCHLQNIANEIKRSKPEENVEKYLTEDFLQQIAARIAQDDVMKFDFQRLLPAETLLQLGKLHYYQRSRSECISSHLEGNETVLQQHCTGKSKCQDVKVNIGVQVGGHEIKIPQSKTEKREDQPKTEKKDQSKTEDQLKTEKREDQ